MTKLEAALDYAQKYHWKLFPCAPDTKVPLIAGGNGVKDATDDVAQITQWWTDNPDANIGLACGGTSKICALDVDVKNEKGVDGFASIAAAGLTIVPTVSQTTPSGGRHYIYAVGENSDIGNAQGLNGMKGVDVRGNGGYIIVAPSSINGVPYVWSTECSTFATYPDAFRPRKRDVKSVFDMPTVAIATTGTTHERARAYLAEIPGAIEHVDGHAKLFWVAQVLVNGFRLSDEEALDLMWSDYNPRCVPPWSRNGRTEKEFRHKVNEARAKPNAEACSIYDATFADEEEAFDFDKCIADVRALIYPKERKNDVPLTKQEAMINDLFVPEGLVGDIAKWMNDTSKCYQPLLSLGASIALCGAIMGRKVCDESNGRTNVYCMGIGPSSSGKDHPGDCINQILTESGADSLIMGRMTSDTAIEKALSIPPHAKIAVMDEVGHFFTNINKAGDGASYLKTIKPTLMELFSSAHKTYIGKEKASGQSPHIPQPCMCLWGVTIPDNLYAGMTVEELQDGWIARNLMFIAPNKIPDVIIRPHVEVPQNIINQVRPWVARSTNELGVITSEIGGGCKPLVVPMDERAKVRFDQFNFHTRDLFRKAHDREEKTQYLWGKCLQNARRIALIVACGKDFHSPVIGYYEANYGCLLTEYLVKNAIAAINDHVSHSVHEAEKMKLAAIIRSFGAHGCTPRDLTRKTQYIKDKRLRESYLVDLIEGGYVVRTEKANAVGKPAVRLFDGRIYEQEEANNGIEHVEEDA